MERLTARNNFVLDNAINAYEHTADSALDRATLDFLKELREYRKSEEQGLILRLPVSIGSDVYFIPSKVSYDLNVLSEHEENNRVYQQKVARITFTERGRYLELDKNLEYGVDHILVDKLYKETWFTSKEEAEQALAEMKGE